MDAEEIVAGVDSQVVVRDDPLVREDRIAGDGRSG